MHPRLSVICSAPLPVCTRALAALKCFARGQRNFSRVMPHAYLVIRIGRRWRLLSKNGGQQVAADDPRNLQPGIPQMNRSPEYAQGALAALHEAKILNLANATPLAVLEARRPRRPSLI
ncbi:Uncharacterised protein [Raoultella terrigena]|uniref:ParE-like toxin domain-containing protein n=1 Tax=Raoultella terrigena TaxID=577 RepID=A0A7Z8ZCW7_RAOTE|nr:Uncharacterised protein [Raoultella terrigena]